MEFISTLPLPAVAAAVIAVLAVLLYVGRSAFQKKAVTKKEDDESKDDVLDAKTIGLGDIAYLMSKLSPESTHMDILWAVASTPESVKSGLRSFEAVEKLKKERSQDGSDKSKTKGDDKSLAFDLDDEGWDDEAEEDDDKDEETKRKEKLAKEADEQTKKDREQLKKATGKTQLKLEGFDKGVIGQNWVETTLTASGVWPPKDLGLLKGQKFSYGGSMVSALDHPGLRRNICMIMGRLNSSTLNSHSELLEAGSKQLIDQTYFQGSMEYRGRCAMLLEATLRAAVACRSYDLAEKVVEAVAMFKVGCHHGKTEWFDGVMQKTYQCLPRLQIKEPTVFNSDNESEIIPGDLVAVSLELTRLHAESFTRQKIAMFQKQGIPPQIALQTYRESWWFLVRAEKLGAGNKTVEEFEINTEGILQNVKSEDIQKFKNCGFQNQLVTAWPMVVQNVAQKSGKVKIQFLSPAEPGEYIFTIVVKSQDFLGADQEFSVQGTVADPATVERKPKEEKPKDDDKKDSTETEQKKD